MSDESVNPNKEPEVFIPVRIAIYDNLRSIPRVVELNFNSIKDFINETSQKTYTLSHEVGGQIPYTIIREIIENLIHAEFCEIIITITDAGNHIIVSDQGPGLEDKEKAFLPGFTSATQKMKEYIRGVGSGLPIVKETITFSGGSIDITDNLKKGTVVSLKIDNRPQQQNQEAEPLPASEDKSQKGKEFENIELSIRQKQILSLILEMDEAGPSKIAKELNFSLSTSYRELIGLENQKLLTSSSSGKRSLSPRGVKYLEYYSNSF
ncbi:MAG: ATP-binding protein [Actinomycetota bacterium]|nr:ATP-binding protein [Actinomycetota bacterium]